MSGKPMDDNDFVRLHGHGAYDPTANITPFDPEAIEEDRGLGSAGAPTEEWPEPQPLPSGLRPVPPLTEAMLPQALRPWLADIAERTQAPPDFAAAGALVALSAAVGRAIAVRPKARDEWEVVPNLWGGVVGRPGVMKTPTLRAALDPLHRIAHQAAEEHRRAVEQVAADAALREARIRMLKRQLQDSVEEQSQTPKRNAKVLRLVPDEHEPASPPTSSPPPDPVTLAAELSHLQNTCSAPIERRYIVNDPTVEKLGELLNQNPRGLLLYRDELVGWLRTLEREGHQCDRAFYLEAWVGNGAPYIYDRIGRGTVRIESPCISILGGIQPNPLADYVRRAVRGGADDDGLIQRFQVLVYPDVGGSWRDIDRWPDTEARNRVHAIFGRLAEPGIAAAVGACPDPDVPEGRPYLRFVPAALEQFAEWRAELERALRGGEEHPALEAHFSKYRSLVPSLALLFHLVQVASGGEGGAVSGEAIALALRWVAYLAAHARRIYGAVTERAMQSAALLGAKLRAGKLPNPFRARDVYRQGWSGLSEQEELGAALEVLLDLSWLRQEPAPPDPARGGRPTVQYRVNPKVGA